MIKVDVVNKTSGKSGNNNDGGRERHVGGRQRQRVSQGRRQNAGGDYYVAFYQP